MMKHYVVVDFEMCRVPKDCRTMEYYRRQEIIQIGAVLLDEKYDIVDHFSSYVKPQFGQLDPFISKLTGIENGHLEDAPMLEEALTQFFGWIPEGDITMVAWSESDQKQLGGEIEMNGLSLPRTEEIMETWIDSQQLFTEKLHSNRCYSLDEALNICAIHTIGHMHDGYFDAYNTALLFQNMMTGKEMKFSPYCSSLMEETPSQLTTTLGDMLKFFTVGTVVA